MALAVPLSRFTSRVGGGSAFYVRPHYTLMANGRGSLECCCCAHYQGESPGYGPKTGTAAWCMFHKAAIPDVTATPLHRICVHFETTDAFRRDTGPDFPVARLFARFGRDMESRVLYGFAYPQPQKLQEICRFDRVA